MLSLLSDSFVLYALAAGIALALVAGPLGSVVVWRRMAYFGDTLAHAALLGVALAIAAEQLPMLGVGLVGIAIAVLLFFLEKQKALSSDTLLGILSHTALALGLIVFATIQARGFNISLMAYLFGDLLAVTPRDLALMYGGVVIILLAFIFMRTSLISISINEDLARVDGVPVEKVRFAFMILLALVVAVALKVVGVMLITSLLIIPAATARLFSKSPGQMVIVSMLVAIVAVLLGLVSSLRWDFPTGPAIVASTSLLFFVSRVFSRVV